MKFTKLEDVKDYADREKVVCLECKREYRMLSSHLRVHEMNEEIYREKYNIPPSIVLTGSLVRLKMSRSNKTPPEVLRERTRSRKMVDSRKSRTEFVIHDLHCREFVEMSKVRSEKKKTKLDVEDIKLAYKIYLDESQSKACKFLGIKAPTFHKWIKRLGLPKKYS